MQKEVFDFAEKCFKLIGPDEEDDNSKRLSSIASEEKVNNEFAFNNNGQDVN